METSQFNKAQTTQFKGAVWFISVLIMVALGALSSRGGTVSAQETVPVVNLTPVSTVEATVEPVHVQLSTNDSRVAAASIATVIPVGISPNGIALNPNTRKAYVINSTSSNVSILDISADNHLRNIWAGQKLYWGIAVKPGTERIYVSDNVGGAVLDIDETTNSVIDTITLGQVLPEGIAINSKLNKAYVAHSGNLLSVIDLSTNHVVKTVNTYNYNHMIAVNEVTNRVYVTRSDYNRVTIIDGNSDTYLRSVLVGSNPWGIAVNSKTNLVYVANSGSNTVTVINGVTDTVIKTISVQSHPWGIAVNEEANRVYVANSWSNSVSIIDGNTNQVVETVPNVGRRPVGVATNPNTGKVYVTNGLGNNVTVILDSAAIPRPTTLTPIILVPGYYASYNAHRMSPLPNDYPDKWEWWPFLWGITSAGSVYHPLIDSLEDVGYNSDPNSPYQNLFIAHYNWLRPNAESATNDLAPVISHALNKTDATKLHIITHSNGGLVTRSWIQNQAASTVVDELIMLAPPNHGVARVYPAWAGGDITRESLSIRRTIFDWLLETFEAPKTCYPAVSGGEVCYYRDETYHRFIHDYIPSARDLIPVYNFLIGSDGQFKNYQDMHPDNRNLALDAMNQDLQNGLIEKVGHITIIGSYGDHDTYDGYVYEDCQNCTSLWLDGTISEDIRLDGDGTVPRWRIPLPGITSIMIEIESDLIFSAHLKIVSEAIPDIFDILQLSMPTPVPTPSPTPPLADALIYTVVRDVPIEGVSDYSASASNVKAGVEAYSVPAQLLITDPLGQKLGYQTNGTFINQIPYAFYHGEAEEPKIIFIPNPIEGTYQTQVIGTNSGTYGVIVSTQKLDRVSKIVTGTTSTGQVLTYDIDYSPPLETYLPLIFNTE